MFDQRVQNNQGSINRNGNKTKNGEYLVPGIEGYKIPGVDCYNCNKSGHMSFN